MSDAAAWRCRSEACRTLLGRVRPGVLRPLAPVASVDGRGVGGSGAGFQRTAPREGAATPPADTENQAEQGAAPRAKADAGARRYHVAGDAD